MDEYVNHHDFDNVDNTVLYGWVTCNTCAVVSNTVLFYNIMYMYIFHYNFLAFFYLPLAIGYTALALQSQ